MAIYSVKLKDNIGGHYYCAYKAQTLPEVMKKLERRAESVISVRHITDRTEYTEGVRQAFQRVMELFRCVQLLAKIADDKADIQLSIHPEPIAARLAISEEQWEIRLIVEQAQVKLENVLEQLNLILELAETRIDED